MIVSKVSPERWQQAQEYEVKAAQSIAKRGDDYNYWWMEQFNNYDVVKGQYFESVLEVGCGPNTNFRLIIPLIDYSKLWLEDPLINEYVSMNCTCAKFIPSTLLPIQLEDLHLSLDEKSMSLVICINVLDHVEDAELCFTQMKRVLKHNGILILGQDLSNVDDFIQCPDSWQDEGHPIKLDHHFIYDQLKEFSPLYDVILPREKGRNPRCHYGTLLWIGSKS